MICNLFLFIIWRWRRWTLLFFLLLFFNHVKSRALIQFLLILLHLCLLVILWHLLLYTSIAFLLFIFGHVVVVHIIQLLSRPTRLLLHVRLQLVSDVVLRGLAQDWVRVGELLSVGLSHGFQVFELGRRHAERGLAVQIVEELLHQRVPGRLLDWQLSLCGLLQVETRLRLFRGGQVGAFAAWLSHQLLEAFGLRTLLATVAVGGEGGPSRVKGQQVQAVLLFRDFFDFFEDGKYLFLL